MGFCTSCFARQDYDDYSEPKWSLPALIRPVCPPYRNWLVCITVVLAALVFLLLAALALANALGVVNSKRVFEIDYENDRFLKDGEPFRYVSGSLHYFRVPRAYWRDRLRKFRAAGLNAVCTYIEWGLHEPSPREYNFTGENDFEHFIDLAQQEGLLVILRPGPYICAERDFGGYPPWLLYKNPAIGLRTNESSHTYYVQAWMEVLFPRIQHLLYGNGGPIIMVQVENEYGSYVVCDRAYTSWLRNMFRSYIGDKAVLFTTDGSYSSYLECTIPGVFITVDFGPGNVTKEFGNMRKLQKHGPLVNSEFYDGWLTHWGDSEEQKVSTDRIVDSTRQLLKLNVSFNLYVFHGGTNFGFTSGANGPPFLPQITSYNYDAPITESGELTEKYHAIKSVISEFLPVEDIPVESSSPVDYGTVALEPKINLFESDTGIDYAAYEFPQTFESLQLYSGFMLYETILPTEYAGRGYLVADDVHDRTIVYVDKKAVGTLSRTDSVYSMIISGTGGQFLGLLVENQGHINFQDMRDHKGITKNVTLQGDVLTGWRHTGYPLDKTDHITALPSVGTVTLPAFYAGNFQLPETLKIPQDTFVNMSGWGKGVLYINDFNLGRYWPTEGPQESLYLPGTYLRQHNTILVMELEKEHPNRTVSLEAGSSCRRKKNH